VPDDERRRRRVGDETKERIADLASGWSVEPAPAAPATPEPPAARKKQKTGPPPPPGSAERRLLEEALVDARPAGAVGPAQAVPAAAPIASAGSGARAKPVTAPPPIPPAARPKPGTAPPPIPPPAARAKPASKPPPAPAPPPLVIDSAGNSGGLAPRGDEPTAIDPQPTRGERVDPTEVKAPSPIAAESKTATGGRLRAAAALRRKRGLLGDVRYVFTAVFGVRRARRELTSLEQRQQVRQASRRRHLVTLGRTAVIAEAFDHAALAEASEALSSVEDERSKHAGAVAAADAELERVRRDREAKVLQHAEGVASLDVELADLGKKLEPLEKDAARVKKRAAKLRESLQRIERKLTETEALLVSVKGEKMDRGAIQAELATLKADRTSVQRDEPAIAAELDALNPRIAAIEAARTEARRKRKELDDGEAEDQRRTAELLEAIGAKRKVVERASGEAETARDRVLFELGEKLYVDRPAILGAQLSPIDAIDLELGESDRRMMELKEILANVDRWKLARGLAVILLVAAAAGTFTWWLLVALS
jgi:hypothetical protein